MNKPEKKRRRLRTTSKIEDVWSLEAAKTDANLHDGDVTSQRDTSTSAVKEVESLASAQSNADLEDGDVPSQRQTSTLTVKSLESAQTNANLIDGDAPSQRNTSTLMVESLESAHTKADLEDGDAPTKRQTSTLTNYQDGIASANPPDRSELKKTGLLHLVKIDKQVTKGDCDTASEYSAETSLEPIFNTRMSAHLPGSSVLIEEDHYDRIDNVRPPSVYDSIDDETDVTSTAFSESSKENKLNILCLTEDSTTDTKERGNAKENRRRRRVKYYEYMVNVFRPLIVKNLIVHDVLPHLTFLEDEGRISAAELISQQQAVICLLDEMKKSKEVRKWERFMKALEQSGYEYIVENIRGTHAIDNTYQVYYLRTLRDKLSRMITPRDLLPRLCAENIITDNTRQEIEQEETNRGRISAALLLLDRIPRKGTYWYRKFVHVLREANMDEAVEMLEIPEIMNCTSQSFIPDIDPHSSYQSQSTDSSIESPVPPYPSSMNYSLSYSVSGKTTPEVKFDPLDIHIPHTVHLPTKPLRAMCEQKGNTFPNTPMKSSKNSDKESIEKGSFTLPENTEDPGSNSMGAIPLLQEICREVKITNNNIYSLRRSIRELKRDNAFLKEKTERLTEDVSKLTRFGRLRSISQDSIFSTGVKIDI